MDQDGLSCESIDRVNILLIDYTYLVGRAISIRARPRGSRGGAARLLAPAQPLVDELLLLLQRGLPLRQLLLAGCLLLSQLLLRGVAGAAGLGGQELQLLQVVPLDGERALQGRDLLVKAHSLALQPLDDLLVRGPDLLRLAVLDKCPLDGLLQRRGRQVDPGGAGRGRARRGLRPQLQVERPHLVLRRNTWWWNANDIIVIVC